MELESAFVSFAEHVRPKVESRLQRRLALEIRGITTHGPEIASACSALTDVCLRGGKRIRAALVFLGARCVRAPANTPLLVDIAAAVELLHAYFLVHDDWMDGDLVRRGGPSAHAVLRDRFGNAAGDAGAILAGDWGATVANHWMAQLDLPRAKLSNLWAAFFKMQRAAILGQLRDTLTSGRNIERTYELKTASYTVEGPLALGAIVSGANSATLMALRKLAIPLGIAFQLRDDLIGLFSAETDTGKPFGSDLKAGKYTAVTSYAFSCARGKEMRVLETVFGNPVATKKQLQQAVQVIESLGAKAWAERRILQLVKRSALRIHDAPITEASRRLLISASRNLALRST